MTVITVIKTIQGSGDDFISKLKKKKNGCLQLTELLTHFFWGCWEAAVSMVCYCVTVVSQITAEKGAGEKEGSNKKETIPQVLQDNLFFLALRRAAQSPVV